MAAVPWELIGPGGAAAVVVTYLFLQNRKNNKVRCPIPAHVAAIAGLKVEARSFVASMGRISYAMEETSKAIGDLREGQARVQEGLRGLEKLIRVLHRQPSAEESEAGPVLQEETQ